MTEDTFWKNNIKKLNQLNDNIELLNSLIALLILDKIETDADRIWKLHKFGIRNKDIAKLLGIPPNNVSGSISQKKKQSE